MQMPANDNAPEVISRADAKARGLPHYFTGTPCKNGGVSRRVTATAKCLCEFCENKARQSGREAYAADPERFKARSLKRHAEKRDELIAAMRARRADNADAVRQRQRQKYVERRDAVLEANREWVQRNKHAVYAKRAEWRKRNRHRHLAANAAYRAARRKATPPWLTADQRQEIVLAYLEAKQLEAVTGIPHHVDHVVPLTNPIVCGLHVPWNLQVIPANDNLAKYNKFDAEAA